jgi:hypothetical protein
MSGARRLMIDEGSLWKSDSLRLAGFIRASIGGQSPGNEWTLS